MSEMQFVCLMVLGAFVGSLTLAEWAVSHWAQARRHRERASDDDLVDWPFDRD